MRFLDSIMTAFNWTAAWCTIAAATLSAGWFLLVGSQTFIKHFMTKEFVLKEYVKALLPGTSLLFVWANLLLWVIVTPDCGQDSVHLDCLGKEVSRTWTESYDMSLYYLGNFLAAIVWAVVAMALIGGMVFALQQLYKLAGRRLSPAAKHLRTYKVRW